MMHESDRRGVLLLNGRAMPDDALARLLGLDVILLKQILTTLDNHGVTSHDEQTGALMSRRMVRDENLRKIRADAGKQGGNPVLLKQIPTTGVKQIPTPSSSSSSSSSSSNTEEREAPSPSEGFAEIPSWQEFWAYCNTQACLLPAEWYARDKFQAAEQDNWKGKSNWRAYARRCKTWWEQDGRPMTQKAKTQNRNPNHAKVQQ